MVSAAASRPRFAHFEQAALHVLRLIGETPSLEKTKLVVTGDLALCKYLPTNHDGVDVQVGFTIKEVF